MRSAATTLCLWIAAIVLAVSVGGNLFQAVVVDPVWSASPPDSLRAFAKTPYFTGIGQIGEPVLDRRKRECGAGISFAVHQRAVGHLLALQLAKMYGPPPDCKKSFQDQVQSA